MILAAPQLYDPDQQPYAWFTMPMLLGWLALLTGAALTAVGMAVALTLRAKRIEDRADEQDQRLDHAVANTSRARADIDTLTDWAHDLEADIATETTAPEPQPATTPQDAAIDQWHAQLADTTRPTPHPRTPARAGRHAHPEDRP